MSKTLMVFILMFISFCAGYAVSKYVNSDSSQIVVLDEPLKILGADTERQYFLPANTVLYHEPRYEPKGESFSSYRVYINVHGKPFKHKVAGKRDMYSPVTAYRENWLNRMKKASPQ